MKLLLIRHGQTPGNVLGQLDTAHPGPGLTELGQRQAQAMARSLANEPLQALYASTLVRTQITAAPLGRLHGLDVTVLDGLHEIEAGALEKLTDHESHKRYIGTVVSWIAGDLEVSMPAGPSGHDFFARFDAAVANVAAQADALGHDAVAIVSHGAAIRTWAGRRAHGLEPDFATTHVLENTGIVALEGTPATGWELIHWDGSPVGGLALSDPTAEDPHGTAPRRPLTQPSRSSYGWIDNRPGASTANQPTLPEMRTTTAAAGCLSIALGACPEQPYRRRRARHPGVIRGGEPARSPGALPKWS